MKTKKRGAERERDEEGGWLVWRKTKRERRKRDTGGM